MHSLSQANIVLYLTISIINLSLSLCLSLSLSLSLCLSPAPLVVCLVCLPTALNHGSSGAVASGKSHFLLSPVAERGVAPGEPGQLASPPTWLETATRQTRGPYPLRPSPAHFTHRLSQPFIVIPLCVCARACVRACERACARACVCMSVGVCACVCAHPKHYSNQPEVLFLKANSSLRPQSDIGFSFLAFNHFPLRYLDHAKTAKRCEGQRDT